MNIADKLFQNSSSSNKYITISENDLELKSIGFSSRLTDNSNSSGYRSHDIQSRLKKGYHNKFTESSYALQNSYTSFSGADSIVSVIFKGGKPIPIGECQTVTYSVYRPTVPVYVLGSAKPKGHVKGPRTIAGSIIFTVFDRHVLVSAFHNAFKNMDSKCLDWGILPDELPSFDIQITFMNEYGQSAGLVLYGVKIASEGQVMSIEDMITENTMQYLASDMQVMEPNILENT